MLEARPATGKWRAGTEIGQSGPWQCTTRPAMHQHGSPQKLPDQPRIGAKRRRRRLFAIWHGCCHCSRRSDVPSPQLRTDSQGAPNETPSSDQDHPRRQCPDAQRSVPFYPAGRRNHQGRHPAFAVRHHGHLRDLAQGYGADDHRRDQRQGRRARQAARAGGGRSGFQLAAVRREGPSAADPGQGGGDLRLLDLGIAQIRAAGL